MRNQLPGHQDLTEDRIEGKKSFLRSCKDNLQIATAVLLKCTNSSKAFGERNFLPTEVQVKRILRQRASNEVATYSCLPSKNFVDSRCYEAADLVNLLPC